MMTVSVKRFVKNLAGLTLVAQVCTVRFHAPLFRAVIPHSWGDSAPEEEASVNKAPGREVRNLLADWYRDQCLLFALLEKRRI